MTKIKIALKYTAKIVTWLFLAACVLLAVLSVVARVAGKSPKIGKYYVYSIATGSMEPAIMTGDVCLYEEAKVSELKEGDIVSYSVTTSNGYVATVTHRIVDINEDHTLVTTKGDANSVTDKKVDLVAADINKVETKYIRTLPILTFLMGIAKTTVGFIVMVFIPLAYLLLSELVHLRQVVKEEKEKEQTEAKNSADSNS